MNELRDVEISAIVGSERTNVVMNSVSVNSLSIVDTVVRLGE